MNYAKNDIYSLGPIFLRCIGASESNIYENICLDFMIVYRFFWNNRRSGQN